MSWLKTLLTYEKAPGAWSWGLHRITGLGLMFYLYLHILALTALQEGPEAFNAEMELFKSPIFMFLEWALFGLVLFHSFNGFRIVLIDLAEGAKYHKKLLYWLTAISIALFAGMGYVIFSGIFN